MFVRFLVCALVLTLLVPALAVAQAPPPPISGPIGLDDDDEETVGPPGLRIGLSLTGMAGRLGMSDINSTIETLTPIARAEWGAPEIRLDRIETGVGYAGGLAAIVKDKWLVLVDYERIIGKSEVGGRLGSSDIHLPANAITATLGYAVYTGGQVHFGFGAGAGRYESDGTAQFVVDEDIVQSVRFEGDAIGQHYVSWVDAPVLGRFRLLVMMGYRSAKIENYELIVDIPEQTPPAEGEEPMDPELLFPFKFDGGSLDWSGFLSRASLVYSLAF
ncbi:MAG: hypothetical protein HKN12_10780 [Gemmatimonadetes bacterium]|nr:hypothetical protein [Gemmatimonadota bacterium]